MGGWYALDTSDKHIIAGPITIGDDDPVTKYQAESDGRVFWAYNGNEVFYEGDRLYHALDEIVRLKDSENEKEIMIQLMLGEPIGVSKS